MRREGRSSKKLQVHSSSSMSVEAAVFVQIWEWKGMRAGACNEHVYFPGPFSSSVRPGFEPGEIRVEIFQISPFARSVVVGSMLVGFHSVLDAVASASYGLSAGHCCRQRVSAISLQQPPDGPTSLFTALLSEHDPLTAITLEGSARGSGGRRLVTRRAVSKGDIVLSVPASLLLTAHRSGRIGGLQGQTDVMWEAAGDLREEVGEELFQRGATWDVRLALAVYEATAGGAGGFWDAYRKLMPPPPTMTHPLCLPQALLPELQNVELQAKVQAKRALFQDLHPSLHAHATHPVTASYENRGFPMEYIPRPLPYAYALVVSRCFAMADGDTFAFVPFLDMAQHADVPTANFRVDAQDGAKLTALADLKPGEEVTINYDPDYSSEEPNCVCLRLLASACVSSHLMASDCLLIR